ncbi:hypothetical protein ABGB19_16035 [Mycobacterium sp. B14F4]|uniref:hypothetical protein n=1 Tax=Mycobacterium sp. B14F4 TaxID=3153565 RepID=UPI00325D81AA
MTESWQSPTDATSPIANWPSDDVAPKQWYRRGIVIGFVAALALALLGVAGYFGINHYLKSRPFTLEGALAVYSDVGLTGGPGCRGTGGYSDIGPGTAVTVSDEDGTLLAKGALGAGYGEQGWCSWSFRVTDVPGGKKFYKVEASHRGEVNFTESEAREGVQLQLGDASEAENRSSPPAAPPAPQSPAPPPPTASPAPPRVTALQPNGGYVYIITKSGKTRCQITTIEVDCQAPFTNTPFVEDMRANGIRFMSDGSYDWVVGDLGDIPVVTLDYGTYRALSWTVEASSVGTRFTHGGTGHSLFVSIDRVEWS